MTPCGGRGERLIRHDAIASAVDFFAMANAEDQHDQAVVFDFADEAVGADAGFPELSEARAAQSLSDAARVVERGDSFVKELQDAPGGVRGEPAEVPGGLRRH